MENIHPPRDAISNPLPVNLKLIERYRDRLFHGLSCVYADSVCTGPAFVELADDLCDKLPGVGKDTVLASITDALSVRLTPQFLYELCWRLAGNIQRLQRGIHAPVWMRQQVDEWVPLHILAAERQRQGRHAGHVFTFRVLAGTACPRKLQCFWSDKFCSYMHGYLGFAKWPPNPKSSKPAQRSYQNPKEFVNLQLFGLLEPKLCIQGPMFHKTKISGSMLDRNRDILDRRDRIVPGYNCPLNLPADFPCYKCPRGYDMCVAGTHATQYAVAACSTCGRTSAAWGMCSKQDRCNSCMDRLALVPKD